MSDLTVPLQSFLRANERCCELLKEKEALRAENERLRVCMAGEGERLTKSNRELRDENKRLKAVERAAQTAYDYHMTGYSRRPIDFDTDTMLALMDALGAALAGKPMKTAEQRMVIGMEIAEKHKANVKEIYRMGADIDGALDGCLVALAAEIMKAIGAGEQAH